MVRGVCESWVKDKKVGRRWVTDFLASIVMVE